MNRETRNDLEGFLTTALALAGMLIVLLALAQMG